MKQLSSHSRPEPANPAELRKGPFGRWTTLSGFAIVLAFGGAFAVWAIGAPIEGAVIAPGTVTVGSNVRTIQHFEGGVVEKINVRDGDQVRPGDVLLQLRPIMAEADVNRIRGELYEVLAAAARLIAERDGLDEIIFPDRLMNSDSPTVHEALENQRSIFTSRRKILSDRSKILERTIAGLEAQIAGLDGQVSANRRQIELAEMELQDARKLLADGLIQRPRVLALEREIAELEGDVSEFSAEIGAARQRIEEARLRLIESEAAEAASIVEAIRTARARANELEQTLAAAEDVLGRTEIRAPVGGVVVRQNVHTIGGVVRGGEPLLDIVPLEGDLVVMASVDPRDIDQVKVGQEVAVWLSASHRRHNTPLRGKVVRISADAIGAPLGGQSHYLARIELTPETFDFGIELQSGMGAEVMIRTGARTAWTYIAAPFQRGMSRAMRES